jgi:hypothetical protein
MVKKNRVSTKEYYNSIILCKYCGYKVKNLEEHLKIRHEKGE